MSARDLFQGVKLDEDGLQRARDYCQWELGDADWAYPIILAYFLQTPEWQEAHDGIHEADS